MQVQTGLQGLLQKTKRGMLMDKTEEAVIERLAEIFDSIRYGMEATIVIHWSSSEIPIINYDIEEAVVKRGGK